VVPEKPDKTEESNMKILYLASNPLDQGNLNLEREITEIQRQATEFSAEPITVVFMPGIHVEGLPRELNRHRPDVVHLAAHADTETLKLAHEAGATVDVTARMLGAFFSRARPPRLVYLNACNSDHIARDLVVDHGVAMAIGSTAPITNRAARNAALSFYDRLLNGDSVAEAFETGQQMLEAMEARRASAQIFSRPDVDLKTEVLHRRPRLVAVLVDDGKSVLSGFAVRFGLVGCSPNTVQVVFFTDDETFINHDQPNLESNLCLVVRGIPVRGAVWGPVSNPWQVSGDFRLFASGVTGDGEHFTVSSTLCEALEARHRIVGGGLVPGGLASTIKMLRSRDGSNLEPVDDASAFWPDRALREQHMNRAPGP
jgi:hypothetical protein